MVNAYAKNRSQPRLEVLNDIANILDVDIKDLIISNIENGLKRKWKLRKKVSTQIYCAV